MARKWSKRVFLMMAALVIRSVFPEISTGLPVHFMGPAVRR